MRPSDMIRRACSLVASALAVLSVIAILTSLSAVRVGAVERACKDTSCWPGYEVICQEIRWDCHCGGTMCE